MNRLINYLALFAVLVPSLLTAKQNLADYLPADSWAVAEVENLDALKKDVEKGPFGEMWNSPAMEKVRKLVDESMMDFSEEGEQGEAIKEMLDRMKGWSEKFSGQVAFSIGGLEDILELPDEDARLPEIIFFGRNHGHGQRTPGIARLV
ncbi:MAG: hypothetical protein VB980_00075 [Opitutales bacterium]